MLWHMSNNRLTAYGVYPYVCRSDTDCGKDRGVKLQALRLRLRRRRLSEVKGIQSLPLARE